MEKPITRSGIIIIIFASLAGLFLSIYATNNSVNAIKAKKWPTVEGTITSSEVAWSSSRYVPKVRYTYRLDSTIFSSERIRLTEAGRYKRKDDAAKAIAKYPVNAKVKVYYNPYNPGESILEPGIKGEHVFMFLIGLIIFIAPLAGLIYTLRSSSKYTGSNVGNISE